MLTELQWPTLQTLRSNARLILLYRLIHHHHSIPNQYLPIFAYPITRANHRFKFQHYTSRTTTVWLQMFVRQSFVNFGNALHITKILTSKILVLYKCSPASYINFSRQYQRAPHRHQMENFPVAASSICNTHDSVSIPCDSVHIRDSLCCRRATQLGTYAKFTPKLPESWLSHVC